MGTRKTITDRINILKGISLFEVLNNEMLSTIAHILSPQTLNEGETLFEKGAKDYSLYLIVNGKVRVHDGEHTFACFTNNQYFGEYSLIDSTPRSASITAIEPTSLLRLDQNSFLKITKDHSEINQLLMKGLIWRLRDYNQMEAELTRKNAEIEQQKAILEKQRKELEALNTTKDKFFAIIAHDLKNPFSTVLGISELLAREFESFDPESLKEFITQIYKYSNNTYNLLENLLQWSMVQTGRMPMSPSTINLASIIDENVELLMGNAKQKKITIESLASNGFKAFADVNMLTTVVRNLLSNAIKFTSNGGNIKVNIAEEGLTWKVSVTDTGIGISEKDMKNLFLLDSNPTSIGTSQEKGTGLGLILCKEFVERNHGKIGVNSLIGSGTTFWFTVPKATS
jgi:signal transduction histidine kinase